MLLLDTERPRRRVERPLGVWKWGEGMMGSSSTSWSELSLAIEAAELQ